jgi:UDP-3-O-[3-hydroxymyristoyl] glucosamine N-acyltransferase
MTATDQELTSERVAEELGLTHHGRVRTVSRPASAGSATPEAIVFVAASRPDLLDLVRSVEDLVVLTDLGPEAFPLATVISTDRPRLDFARVLTTFFAEEPPRGIHPTAIVASTARLGQRVTIGAYAVVDDGVEIGDDAIVGEHVVLRRR